MIESKIIIKKGFLFESIIVLESFIIKKTKIVKKGFLRNHLYIVKSITVLFIIILFELIMES